MLTFKRKPWALTLFVSLILAISFASVVDAKDFERRDHAVLKRFVKKRSPDPASPLGLGNANDTPVGAAEDPADKLSAGPSGSAIVAAPSLELPPSLSPSLPAPASDSPAPSAASQSSAPVSIPPSQSPSAPSQPAASQSNAPPSSPPPAASTPPPPPPSKPTPENQAPSDPEPSESGKKGTATVFRYQTQTPSPESAPPHKSGNTSAARVSITIIAVIAGVVGAIAVAWTIFRKWKLRSSKKFDERLNPIDWQPSNADDGDLPGARRHSTASSFHSGSGHSTSRGYGATNHGGSIPDHDFTAGASLSPGGGYTDMARGPSPQPQMMETNAYGANMYSHHDQYGVPLHHQGYGGPNYYNGSRPY